MPVEPAQKAPTEAEQRDLLHRKLPAVLDHFRITSWDVLLVGDGSGQSWSMGCGWACAVIDKATMMRKLLWGGWSSGTVGIGEMMPYLHGLAWYHANVGKLVRKQNKSKLLEVHCICDNETVVRQGQREMDRDANAPLWAAIDQCLRNGYLATWHWARRDTIGLNSLVDHVSRCARLAVSELSMDSMVPEMPGASIYNFNPG